LNHIADAYIVNDFAGLNEHRRNNLFGNESLSEETRLRIIRLLLKMNIDIDVLVYNEDYDIEYPIYEYVIDLIEIELYEKSRRDNIINRYLLGVSKNEYNEYKVELDQDTMIVTDDEDLYKEMKKQQIILGALPGVEECWLVLRGMKTMEIRMKNQSLQEKI